MQVMMSDGDDVLARLEAAGYSPPPTPPRMNLDRSCFWLFKVFPRFFVPLTAFFSFKSLLLGFCVTLR